MSAVAALPAQVLALALLAAQDPAPWPEVDARSPSGDFAARVRKAPGQERVPDPLARWRLTVHAVEPSGELRELFSGSFAHRGGEHLHLLADAGPTFAQVSRAYEPARPVVRLVSPRGTLEIPGETLGLPPGAIERSDSGKLWLADGGEPARLGWIEGAFGPLAVLELGTRDGAALHLDLASGAVVEPGWPHPEVAVEPQAKTLAGMEPAFVGSLDAPERAVAGEPLELRVQGSLPTPAWRLSGFRMRREGDLLTLVPMGERRAVRVAPQVEEPFSARPRLLHLPAGTWRVRAEGRGEQRTPARELDVLPAGLLLRLAVSGGIAGVSQRIDVLESGVVHGSFFGPSRYAPVPRAALAELRSSLAALPAGTEARNPVASDLVHFELGWWRDGAWLTARFDDFTVPPDAKPLLERLHALLQ